MRLKDKAILITGAARGIGRAIALGMAREGADIGINYVKSRSAAESIAEEIRRLGRRCCIIQADVSKVKDCYHLVDEFVKYFGKIDVLVNNAGICIIENFTKTTEESFDRVMDTNLKGGFFCAQAAVKKMIPQGYGTIINMSSLNGTVAEANQSVYNASKGAINILTKSMALELAPYNIKVNGLGPGFILTDAAKEDIHDPAVKKEYLSNIPMGRFGVPDDVVGAAIFLASSESDYFVGQTLYMDGGIMIQQMRQMGKK